MSKHTPGPWAVSDVCEREIERLATVETKAQLADKAIFRRSFCRCRVAVAAINERLKAQRQAYTGGRIMKQVGTAPRRNVRNECAKTRPASDPYEIWQSPDGQWTWKVLKKWQVDDNKPFARWFCFVTSPFCPEGEYGDTYVRDIKAQARQVAIDPETVL